MLTDLGELFAAVPPEAVREDYRAAIVDENVLGKATAANRRGTGQRLGELYALDPRVPLFRVLRRLWSVDVPGRPLLAMLCALARDPLLRAAAPAVLALPAGAELLRPRFRDQMREVVGARLNESVLDKAARNAASSWTQSGHLRGRGRKDAGPRRADARFPGAGPLARLARRTRRPGAARLPLDAGARPGRPGSAAAGVRGPAARSDPRARRRGRGRDRRRPAGPRGGREMSG